MAIVNAKTALHVNIPETLYYNYSSYLLYTEKGKVHIKKNPGKEDFLTKVEADTPYDIVKNWLEPAVLLKSTSSHPCYTKVKLMNWKGMYEHLEKGPSNKTLL
jgi:hypothetical protein